MGASRQCGARGTMVQTVIAGAKNDQSGVIALCARAASLEYGNRYILDSARYVAGSQNRCAAEVTQ